MTDYYKAIRNKRQESYLKPINFREPFSFVQKRCAKINSARNHPFSACGYVKINGVWIICENVLHENKNGAKINRFKVLNFLFFKTFLNANFKDAVRYWTIGPKVHIAWPWNFQKIRKIDKYKNPKSFRHLPLF